MNKSILFVGDMHVKKDNIEESNRLIDYIIGLAIENDCAIVFAGDQYNDHSIIHASVLDFWNSAYTRIKATGLISYSLVGNHDLSSDYKYSPMHTHSEHTNVVLQPQILFGEVGAVGYVKKNEDFCKKVNDLYSLGARLIFCHAEFDGASFDNGFYIPNGIDASVFPDDLVFVSGHIHSKQELVSSKTGKIKVYYSGTPRMLTRSDIGKNKSVMMINLSKNQFDAIPIPETVCEPFKYYIVCTENDIQNIPNSDRVYVDIKGEKDFINSAIEKMPSLAKIRTIPNTEIQQITTVSETDGIHVAFYNYLKEYCVANNADLNEIVSDAYRYIPNWGQQ